MNLQKFRKNVISSIENNIEKQRLEKLNIRSTDDEIKSTNELGDSKNIFLKNLRLPFHKQEKLIYPSIEFMEGRELYEIISNFIVFHGKPTYLFEYIIDEDNEEESDKTKHLRI
ncbi:MAG: hypothetical protein ACK452_16510, partial [Bacteroidota bacterium]